MDDRAASLTFSNWVDVTHGVVAREAFASDNIYRKELDRIFRRNWIYLGHESEIKTPGQFVVRSLAGAPIIVVRDEDGSIHAVLNSCRHRGAKLCRAESGTSRRFICPYHGWSYERNGRLVTTGFDSLLPSNMDMAEWSLLRVPQVETYSGLIFGCWDPNAISLTDYLGDFRWYIDLFLARSPGGMEVLAPPHRWRTKANWKIGALNFIGDAQHVATTHMGPITLDPVRAARAGLAAPSDTSTQIMLDGGHGATLTYLMDGLADSAYQTHAEDLLPLYRQALKADQVAALEKLRVAVGTIFPNLSFIETQTSPGEKAVVLRLWQPISGSEMEVLSWVLAECEASETYKANVLRKGFHNFGVAGVFEQDDMELWESLTAASGNEISQELPFSFHTALPYLDHPLAKSIGPGRAYRPSTSEVAQFEFMRHWQNVMSGAENDAIVARSD